MTWRRLLNTAVLLCRKRQAKTEEQCVADLPIKRLKTRSPPFYHTSCDCFGPYHVKTSTNKKSKIFLHLLKHRSSPLRNGTYYSTMDFLQTLQRFFSLHGQPSLRMSDNVSQFVGAELKAND